MAKIDGLKTDKAVIENCIKGLESEIQALNNSKTPDNSSILKKMKDKTDAQEQLDKILKDLEIEEFKEKNKPPAAGKRIPKELFDSKNNSYNVVRSSYMKSIDN